MGTENDAATVINSAITLSDVDDTDLTGAKVSISNGSFVNGDVLAFAPQAGIMGSYDSVAGKLILEGSATVARYQAVLASVTYKSSSQNPTVSGTQPSRTISWTVTDADSDGAGAATTTVISTINIIPINDAPIAIDQ